MVFEYPHIYEMGLPTEHPVPPPVPPVSPKVVCFDSFYPVANAFLEQYYGVLHGSPELFHQFYQDSSIVMRPDSNGVMRSVTTTQAINDLILSLDNKNCITEILSADSQQSYKDGVFIQVIGFLIGLDRIRRKFSQSFFLSPQGHGVYFVLNDIFRFVDDNQQRKTSQMLANGDGDAQIAPLIIEQGDPSTLLSEELYENGGPNDIAENGSPKAEVKFAENVDTEEVPEVLPPTAQEDSPKSYASILVKGNASPIAVHVPTTKVKPVFPKPEKVPLPSTTPARASEVTTSGSNSTSETNDSHKGGHSIFVRNLPLDATVAQLEEVFKKFGPIKPQGVQVRSHKLEHNCFGFVEFESLDSKQAAMEASPIMIGGRQAFIAEKKTTARVSGGSSRFSMSRGGNNGGGVFQNDNFRVGRGGFGGNQGGFARNEFRNTRGGGEYSGRGRAAPRGRVNGAYRPRIVQNVSRPNMTNQTAIVA
ncbi:ras GTPase-activating protein-binding protein 1-like isoform X2 [Asparagus officinalis]|uniref:ras GTPase-activating protein-binding protein 1-like isoform X2 n=1 Tax=Asparagus officinalis TaxID=4686 RepID=UPI00098E6EB5|nr:ras GTPase-activating protein-binding protein 1-like isoform X2 [Asparagus officinalis]